MAEFDRDTPQANGELLNRILCPNAAPLSKLRQAIEDWENDASYEARTEKDVSEDLIMTSIQSMCRERLVDHVELQARRLDTFAKCKNRDPEALGDS